MQILRLPASPAAVICDVDDTLYEHSSEFKVHTFQMDCEALSILWAIPASEIAKLLQAKKAELQNASDTARKLTMRDVIMACGNVDDVWLGQTRAQFWQPSNYIREVPGLAGEFRRLQSRGWKIGFASTSHTPVVVSLLRTLGLSEFGQVALGMEFGLKPNPGIYREVAVRLDINASDCISIGDSLDNDCLPALSLGMGAVKVSGPMELIEFLSSR